MIKLSFKKGFSYYDIIVIFLEDIYVDGYVAFHQTVNNFNIDEKCETEIKILLSRWCELLT